AGVACGKLENERRGRGDDVHAALPGVTAHLFEDVAVAVDDGAPDVGRAEIDPDGGRRRLPRRLAHARSMRRTRPPACRASSPAEASAAPAGDRCDSTARSPASTTAWAARSSSRPALIRCSAASGAASNSAASAASAVAPNGGGSVACRSAGRSLGAVIGNLHELDFESPVGHTGTGHLAAAQTLGKNDGAPVRAYGDEQLAVAATELDVGPIRERQLHRQDERVAVGVDAERLYEREPGGRVAQPVQLGGEVGEVVGA